MSRHWGALLGLLWVHVYWVRGLEVEQSPSVLSLQEGAGAALKCNFSSSVQSVQWFRQNPGGGGLTQLIYVASGMKQSGRLNCTLNTRERSSTLHIAASQLEDAASYLCALETQCCLLIWGLQANCSCTCALAPPWGICTHSSLDTFSDFQVYVIAPFPSKMRPIRLSFHLLFLPFFFPESPFQLKSSTVEPLEQVTEEVPISNALGNQISWQVAYKLYVSSQMENVQKIQWSSTNRKRCLNFLVTCRWFFKEI
ncbi:uncharacterized protein LOC123792242 [Ursus americanus]|uniref:uncharacterized protein LOC123792242 n=1 Tax=Ursus americanus TaxID=9643 RepID=UPI001E67DB8B|nr:uncharacterized protein LOC123792242 [Ursus americanus]